MACSLAYKGITFCYPDGTLVLDGIDLDIKSGEHVALLGPNGAGKSTLMLHTNGILRAKEGEVVIDKTILSEKTLIEIRERVGLVFQDPDDQLFMTSVEDDVAFGPRNRGLSNEEAEKRTQEALVSVGLLENAKKSGQDLSFGQKKRAALATVLSMRPDVLILDEPTSNLDPKSRGQMIELLSELKATTLVATHDMDLAWELCSRTIILNHGHIVADGKTREILCDESLLLANDLELPAAVRFGNCSCATIES